jgi:hypothetical protein
LKRGWSFLETNTLPESWIVVPILLVVISTAANAQPTSQPTLRTPFVIGVWQQPASSAAKWKVRGVDTLYGHDIAGGRVTKEEWDQQVSASGMKFISEAGANPMAEAMQPGRVGFCQKDEADSSLHAGTPGNTLADLTAVAARARPTTLPVYANFDGHAFDNPAYDGRKHRNDINADRPFWHNAADGGYFAQADVVGFDYHLWTGGRPGAFDITKRLMDRANDWSGGKPIFVYVETCTQGTGKPFTADDYERQVWTVVDYAKLKGYRLAGIVYFTHQVFPTWKSYDMTAPDVVDRMVVVNAKLRQQFAPAPSTQPTTQPTDLAPILAQLDALRTELARVRQEYAANDDARRAQIEALTVTANRAESQAKAAADRLEKLKAALNQ